MAGDGVAAAGTVGVAEEAAVVVMVDMVRETLINSGNFLLRHPLNPTSFPLNSRRLRRLRRVIYCKIFINWLCVNLTKNMIKICEIKLFLYKKRASYALIT